MLSLAPSADQVQQKEEELRLEHEEFAIRNNCCKVQLEERKEIIMP